MEDWEKINEPTLPAKEDFYSQLNMKDNTDKDYTNAKNKKTKKEGFIKRF